MSNKISYKNFIWMYFVIEVAIDIKDGGRRIKRFKILTFFMQKMVFKV